MIPPAYSDLTKPVNDLLSKDFPIGTSKLELNTTSENGVKFTATGTKDNKSGGIASELKTKFSDKKNGLTFTETWNTSNIIGTTVELSDIICSGLKMELKGELNPDSGKKTAKASIDYKQQYFFSRAGLDLFKGPTINADTVVGHCGVVVGGDVAYDVADAKLCKMGASVAHIAKDYTMVAQSSNMFNHYSFSYHHRVQSNFEAGARASWTMNPTYAKAVTDAPVTLEIGSKYTLDGNAFIKAKINNNGLLGLGYTQTLRPGVKLALGGNFDTTRLAESAHKVGMSLTFDA